MTPKPLKLQLICRLPSISEDGFITNKEISTNPPPKKEYKRDQIFTRFQKPFGIEIHAFNWWMMFLIPTAFSMYFVAEYSTFKYPFSSIFLWSKCIFYYIIVE